MTYVDMSPLQSLTFRMFVKYGLVLSNICRHFIASHFLAGSTTAGMFREMFVFSLFTFN